MSISYNFSGNSPLKVSPLLIEFGIPLSLSGHRSLYAAVNIYHLFNQTIRRIKITKDICPKVAHQYGTTSQCVERSIRHAVGICFT